jgi:hypothetical protein
MNQIKNLKIVIFVIVVLLILVIVRNCDQNLFKEDVKTAVEAIDERSNLITLDRLQKISEPYLVIDLGSEARPDSFQFQHSMQIPFENLLDKANRTIFDEAEGDLVLFSSDIATASKAWMILNQLGYKNLFILTSEENPEELKYKFQPDTTARLEQDSI